MDERLRFIARLLEGVDHPGLHLFGREPAARLDELGDRVGYGALGRRLGLLAG